MVLDTVNEAMPEAAALYQSLGFEETGRFNDNPVPGLTFYILKLSSETRRQMTINFHVVKSTVVGALGGLLFGFDTAVISGTTNALTQVYHLSPALLGVTVSSALLGTVVGAMTAGIPGQKFGRRDSLRVMAIFYVVSALGCAFAWNWPALIFFRFIGGLGIGGSSVLGPMYIAEIAPPGMARTSGWLLSAKRGHRHFACLCIQCLDRHLAAWRHRMALAARHLRGAGGSFPACPVWYSAQPSMAGHARQAR